MTGRALALAIAAWCGLLAVVAAPLSRPALALAAGGPPHIDAVMAYGGGAGLATTIQITGSNLGGATRVDLGQGITVSGLTVSGDSDIRADIVIESGAESAAREVSVTTPAGTATYPLPPGFLAVAGGEAGEAGEEKASGGTLWVFPAAAGVVIMVGLLLALELWVRARLSGGRHE